MTAVKHIADSHDASGLNTGRAEVLYGTHNGILGQLFLDHMAAKKGWTMKSSVHKGVPLSLMHPATWSNASNVSCAFIPL